MALSIDDLIADFQQASDEARESNLERYEEVLEGYQGLRERQISGLAAFGESARSDIDQRFDTLQTSNEQSLVSRGLTGTTIAPSLASGVERDRSRELTRLDESINQQQLGADLGITQAMLGFQERREDLYPDMNALASLSESMGQGQAAREDELSFWEWLGF